MTYIQQERQDNILTLKLDINEVNSFIPEAFDEMIELLHEVEHQNEIRAIVLTSGKEGFFSNGLDPAAFLETDPEKISRTLDLGADCSRKYFELPIPTVCAINGHAMGYGAVMAMFSDYRVMSDKGVRIGFPEVNIGLGFPVFTTLVLQDLVGMTSARDLLYSGKALKGPEATSIGLVDQVAPAEQVQEAAFKQAKALAGKSHQAMRSLKTSMRWRYSHIAGEISRYDSEEGAKMLNTSHAKEGFSSILEKRRPKFD